MSTSAVQLRPFRGGTDSVTLDSDQLALVPVAEAISVGEPPVTPTSVGPLTVGRPVRSSRSVSGVAVTAPLDVAPRPRFGVRWGGIDKTERDALLAFLRDDAQDGAFGFDLRPDGSGSDVMSVRALAPARDGEDGEGSYTVDLEVEELRS